MAEIKVLGGYILHFFGCVLLELIMESHHR